MFDLRALRLAWLVEHGHNAEDVMEHTSREYRNFMFGVVDSYLLREQIASDPKKNRSSGSPPPRETRIKTRGVVRQNV